MANNNNDCLNNVDHHHKDNSLMASGLGEEEEEEEGCTFSKIPKRGSWHFLTIKRTKTVFVYEIFFHVLVVERLFAQ